MRSALLLLFLCLAARSASATPIVLRAARLFDGRTQSLQQPGVVVIDGAKISAVGPSVAVPAGAQIIDLGDATLMPGLMDAHTHVSFESSEDWKQDELDALKHPIPQQAIEAVRFAQRTLLAGFTTVRDLGSEDLIDVGLRNAIAAGHIPGPRMLVAVNAIGARGGHCDWTAGYRPGILPEPGIAQGVADGPVEVRAAVRWNTKHGADVIKVCASGGVLSLTDKVDSAQYTQAELDALVDEAHALGRKAAAHAHGAEAIKRAVRAGIDSIEHGTFADDEALALMKRRGTPYVYTPTLCLARRMRTSGAPIEVVQKNAAADARGDETFKLAVQRGVTIAFGSDAAVCPHGSQWEQLAHMVSLGMPPLAVLRSATSTDARLFGVDDRLGTLERGKFADVIAVAGDPTRDMRAMKNVRLVMKEGVLVTRPETPAGGAR
jgi:imidazolonepropionase-like amidohydrolase